jgi:hypothetical protein
LLAMLQLLLSDLLENMAEEFVVLDVLLGDVPVSFELRSRKLLFVMSYSHYAIGVLDNENLLPAQSVREFIWLDEVELSFVVHGEIAAESPLHLRLARSTARRLCRASSTISRELRRNAATRSGGLEYRAVTAQWHAERRAKRPKVAKLATNAALRSYVHERLAGAVKTAKGKPVAGPQVRWKQRRHGNRQDRRWARAWSPQQIANRLPIDFPDNASMRISHEAIYQALYVQGRGALRRELTACLRTGRVLRTPRARTRGRGKHFTSPEVMISQRPAEVEDRAVPGHWGGDLIIGMGSSAIGTLVERTTRFTMLLHLPRMDEYGQARVKNGPASAGHGAKPCETRSSPRSRRFLKNCAGR